MEFLIALAITIAGICFVYWLSIVDSKNHKDSIKDVYKETLDTTYYNNLKDLINSYSNKSPYPSYPLFKHTTYTLPKRKLRKVRRNKSK